MNDKYGTQNSQVAIAERKLEPPNLEGSVTQLFLLLQIDSFLYIFNEKIQNIF
jgi:hypothetical protein